MGLNCQSFANDCNVNARAFLPAPPGFGICRLNMRSEEKIRGQGRLQSTSTCIGVQTRLRAAAQYDPELIVLRENPNISRDWGSVVRVNRSALIGSLRVSYCNGHHTPMA